MRMAREIDDLNRRMLENEAQRNTLQGMVNGLIAQIDAQATAVDSVHVDTTAITPNNTLTAVMSGSIPVPAGFTRAVVSASTGLTVRNTTAGQDALQLKLRINGAAVGKDSYFDTAAGFLASPQVSNTRLVLGISGAITISALVGTVVVGSTWTPADGYHFGNLDAEATFLR
jgi:hypothetical protein